ncbi:sensor histidine kinase [Haloparvum sp. AD34]
MAIDRERALKALNTIATELKAYESREAVCERTIEAAESILEFDICVINLEEDGHLPITAISSATPPDGTSPMTVEEGLVGLAYRTGESIIVDDLEQHEAATPQGPYQSALTVPIGKHGVFQTVSNETGAFTETDRELAELLVAHCEAALDRIEHAAEIRERSRKLERQNKRLAEFADVVSHDLRNPLNVLTGHLELARETGDPEHFDRCEAAIERMETLIDDLLTLAREGEAIGEVEPVDLETLVERCLETTDVEDATVEVEGTLQFQADPDRVRQLIENLLRNAVEHAGPDVAVRIGPLPDGSGFYVADDGPGVPEADRDQVFEAGYSTAEEGTGFGLSIVREVARAHGWSVDVTDSDSGGAQFEITGVEPA